MTDKLTLLLDKMNVPDDVRKYFVGGSLEKIICNKNQDKYVFLININEVLSLGDFFNFEDLLRKTFSSAKSVETKFTVKDFNVEILIDYYRYYMSEYSKNAPLLEMFVNSNLKLEDGELILEVANKAEEMKFLSIKEDLEKKLKYAGFDINIKLVIDEEKAEEIRKEIENAKTAEIPVIPKKENPIIMGGEIKSKMTDISSLTFEMDNVAVEAKIFGKDLFESSKSDFKIITLKIYDGTDSMYCKIFCRDASDFNNYNKRLKEGNWYKIKGYTKNDKYSNEIVLNARDINVSDKKEEVRTDESKEKRVELHAHTKMSQMDGICDAKTLVKTAYNWGHRAIAITDHNGVQSFPDVYHTVCDINKKKEGEPFKALYGVELTLIDDTVDIVLRPTDEDLLKTTYVVFDFETTGFNAGGADSIIEVGAVKICNGEIVDRFSELINPGRKLPAKIIEVTNITDDMLAGKDNEETVIKRFIDWYGDLPMVAHNAKFDVSFLKMAYKKYDFGEFTNTVIDTLELSRTMDNNFARHSLSALVKRYDVPWDENAHHRADYDAEGTALVFHKMLKKLEGMNYEKIKDLDRLVSKDEIHKYGNAYHVNLLALNRVGLKNLFKIVSLANTKYMYKTPRILRSEIENHREGLLVGSGCYESEIFKQARSKSDEELSNLINFYDYVEVQPVAVYDHLIQMNDFGTKAEIISHLMKIIRVTKEAGKLIVASGDVHHINPDDRIYREIIVNQKVPGGGRHPLSRKGINQIPNQYFRTTEEMLEDFSFLGKETAYEIVVENPNKIASEIEEIEVIIDTPNPFAPRIPHSVETMTELVYQKADELYGNPLPFNIEERLAKELYGDAIIGACKEENADEAQAYQLVHETINKGKEAVKDMVKKHLTEEDKQDKKEEEIEKLAYKKLGGIIGANYDVIYLIAQKLVKHSNDEGYLVGSRGSVGSSFVANMMGITEVNSLPAHYRCPKCKTSIFNDEEGKALGITYSCGFDLPDKKCPNCKAYMAKDGHDIPFATFLGFNADKVPDIDLNFSGEYQAKAHRYTEVIFGKGTTFKAGTVGTVAEKTAYGYVKKYYEERRNTSKFSRSA